MKKQNKAPSFKEMVSKTFKIIKDYKNHYILIILFCLLAALFSALAPYFLGYATDSLYDSIKNGVEFNYPYIIKVLIIVLACYIIDALCTYFKSYMSSKLGQEIGYDLRRKLINKINVTKLRKLDSMKKGDIKKFDKESKTLAEFGFKSSFYSSLAVPFNKAIGNLNYIIIVCVGSISVIKGNMRLGAIQSFIQYMKDFNRPMNVIAQVISNLQMAIASVDRVYEILDLEEETNGKIKEFTFNDSIEFKDVTFSYVEGKIVLKNFNLKIHKGEKIALVGKTGAGKTTIVNLLMNFHAHYTGQILIDGVDIRDIDKTSYRKLISMVLQDTWLFEGTIKDNIVFDKRISDDKLSKALSKSKILHMIEGLPNGLLYQINEETNNMSAGEKQLLTIARALVADPEILILDEATSNVDTRLEYLINHSMNSLMKDRTSIVIAHRLSTIVESDKIVVIKNGQILEVGTHKELLKNKGYYYDLYSSQFDLNE